MARFGNATLALVGTGVTVGPPGVMVGAGVLVLVAVGTKVLVGNGPHSLAEIAPQIDGDQVTGSNPTIFAPDAPAQITL